MSLRGIARELGLSAPALYRYYPSKDSLYGALRAGGFDQLQVLLAEARTGTGSALQAAEQAIRSYVRFGLDNPDLYALMYDFDKRDMADQPVAMSSRRRAFAQAEAIAADLIHEYQLNDEPNQLAHLLWINAHGLIGLAIVNQLDLGQKLEDLIDPVLVFLRRGLLNREG